MKIIDGGVTAAKGFKAASTAAEIKYKGRTDMAMVFSEVPCVAAGTFTTNVVKAAPVRWDQDIVYNHPGARAVICNSGIANACTGEEGFGYCRETAKAASESLGIPEDSVLVASTGVIGMQLPIDRIANGVKAMAPKLEGSREAGLEAAKAIMTTDTEKKEAAVEIEIGGKTVTVGGMCKGSGMIHPNMCTMLGFITSDVDISKELLQEALSEDIKDTYNMVSVDGDTSTNDTVLLLANGQAGNPAKGFKAASTAAEIKYKGRTDMAMVFSEVPCVAAGTFTTNVVKAAPVRWDQDIVYNHPGARAVICNSGIANACTGEEGFGYCRETAKAASESLGIPEDSVLVASTGVIGMQLPIDRIANGVKAMAPKLAGSREAGLEAAKAIMTTDTEKKEAAVEIEIGGKTVTVGGMCKGSGMIHPNMCTMLGFITSDVDISKELLQEALSEDIKDTYNMVSVDGDTSTNDTVLLLANGQAGNPKITEKNADYEEFKKALNYVNTTLAKKIAGDGEGATALFEVKVIGAATKAEAVTLSKSVVTSSLTKAAIYGHDANWGRILCALGYSGVQFDPEKVDLYFESKAGKIKIIENGVSTGYSEEEATKILSEEAVTAIADMKMGDASATAWGCDLTYDYIKINADYRS